MIRVVAPHGTFQFPEGTYFEYVTGGELDIRNQENDLIAVFDKGQWLHVASVVEESETAEQAAAPRTARVWDDFTNIPPGIEVKDKDGDAWLSTTSSFSSRSEDYELRSSSWGPFTEVV